MSIEPSAPQSLTSEASPQGTSTAPARWVSFACDPLPWPVADARKSLGGKGLSLHLLEQAGLAVSPAFTIVTDACCYYHQHQRQWPEGLWEEVRSGIARLEVMTGRLFGRGPNPLTVAVRSGAAESMPGLMSTFLHCGITEGLVRCQDNAELRQAFAEFQKSSLGPVPDDPEAILRQAVSAVFDSWETAGVRQFRKLRALEHMAGTAVTIQVMFEAEISGVAFSRNPEQPFGEHLIIEAIPGSGSDLVGGRATPARWSIDRSSLAIVDQFIPVELSANVAVLKFVEHCLKTLCQAVKQIEGVFHSPVDVEFGYARGELSFFQARPITGPRLSPFEAARAREIEHLQRLRKAGRNLWVRHNLSETLPAPTPLTWDLWREFMSGHGGYGKLYRQLGFRPSARVQSEGFLELIGGRIYADPQRLTEMISRGYPLCYDTDALRTDPNVLNGPPTRLDLEQLDPWFLWRWPFLVATLIRAARRRRRLASYADRNFEHEVVGDIRAYVSTERQVDLSALATRDLYEIFNRRRRHVFDEFAPRTLLPGTLGALACAALEQRLRPVLGDADCPLFMQECLARIANPLADRERELLRQIGEGEASVEDFLREYGHRGPNEMDLSAPRWREQPMAVQEMALRMEAISPGASDKQMQPSPDERLRIALVRNGASCLYRELSALLGEAMRLLPYREAGKHELLKAYELLREVVVELGRRLNVGEDIHFLNLTVLQSMACCGESERLEGVRDAHQACQQLNVPVVLEITDDLTDFGRWPTPASIGRVLTGTTLSLGEASGRVHLLNEGRSLSDVPTDAVIVAPTLDPGWLPFLAHAAALLVEQGGVLSHVALLSRQFSIPMVVIPDITRQVQEGEAIRVDANRGCIELTERCT